MKAVLWQALEEVARPTTGGQLCAVAKHVLVMEAKAVRKTELRAQCSEHRGRLGFSKSSEFVFVFG